MTCKSCEKSLRTPDGSSLVQPETVCGMTTRWCWGSFLLTWIWALGNGAWLGLLAVLPWLLAGLVFMTQTGDEVMPLLFFLACIERGCAVWLGVHGGRLAWRKSKWDSLEHFVSVQKGWTIAGACVWTALGIHAIFLLVFLSSTFRS